MIRRTFLTLLGSACVGATTPALAARPGGCPGSMLRTVEQMLPHVARGLDPSALSCHGLWRVYDLLTRSRNENTSMRRTRILAVFRREGLVR